MLKKSIDLLFLINEIKRLNPSTSVIMFKDSDENVSPLIFCSFPPEELILPQHFDYSIKDGINNKNLGCKENYISLQVEQV